jgi:hypothetical protein
MFAACCATGQTEYRPFRHHEDALRWLVTDEQAQ